MEVKFIKQGLNLNIKNKSNNYYLFQENCDRNKNNCYDGLDKYGFCCFIYDNNNKIIKNRYADYPW